MRKYPLLFLLTWLFAIILIGCSHNTDNFEENCLLYLGNPVDEPEIWRYCERGHTQITQSGGRIIEFGVQQNENLIYFIRVNEAGGSDIWQTTLDGRKSNHVYSCEIDLCRDLAVNPSGNHLAFVRQNSENSLVFLTLDNNDEVVIETEFVTMIDFSPNGKYLRYYDNHEMNLIIIDIEEKELISMTQADEDLIGSWNDAGSRFIFGKRTFNGSIADFSFQEINLLENTTRELFRDLDPDTYITNPAYIDNVGYLARIQQGFKSNRKQIWIIDEQGELLKAVTDDQLCEHANFTWLTSEEMLVFQKYDVTKSDSLPEIWVWDSKEDEYQIIVENGAYPVWIY